MYIQFLANCMQKTSAARDPSRFANASFSSEAKNPVGEPLEDDNGGLTLRGRQKVERLLAGRRASPPTANRCGNLVGDGAFDSPPPPAGGVIQGSLCSSATSSLFVKIDHPFV